MPSRYVEEDGRTLAPQGSLSTLYEDDLSDDDLDDPDSEGIELDDDSSDDDGSMLPVARPQSARPKRPSSSRTTTPGLSRRSQRPTSAPAVRQKSATVSTARKGLKKAPVTSRRATARGSQSSRNFFADPEQMSHEIITLKKQVVELEQERTMLKSRAQRMESEVSRKERQLDSMLTVSAGSMDAKSVHFDKLKIDLGLVKNLKAKNKTLSKKLREKTNELEDLKADAKYTKIAEKDMEIQIYYKETVRLRELLEERSIAQDEEDEVIQENEQTIHELDDRLRSVKLENKELKRDARALVEKTAEWEEENRYLQVELLQSQKKLSILPKKQASALEQVSGESRELRLALEKAQLDVDMQNIAHSKEIQKLEAENRALQQLAASTQLSTGAQQSNGELYWRERAEAAAAEYDRRLHQETNELRSQVLDLQQLLVPQMKQAQPQMKQSNVQSAAQAEPAAISRSKVAAHNAAAIPSSNAASRASTVTSAGATSASLSANGYVSSPDPAQDSFKLR